MELTHSCSTGKKLLFPTQMENSGVVHMLKTDKLEGTFQCLASCELGINSDAQEHPWAVHLACSLTSEVDTLLSVPRLIERVPILVVHHQSLHPATVVCCNCNVISEV